MRRIAQPDSERRRDDVKTLKSRCPLRERLRFPTETGLEAGDRGMTSEDESISYFEGRSNGHVSNGPFVRYE